MGITKEQWKKIIEDRKSQYKIDPLNIYSDRFFRKKKIKRDGQMRRGEILSNLFNIESMIDFGCGLGFYLEGALKGKTKKVFGIDICYDYLIKWVPEDMRPFIKKGHAGKQLDFGKWDCSFSFDTAEHLLPEEESIFIDNIVNASSRLIVFYAEKKFNKLHLNPGKKKKYWVDIFLRKNCEELINKEKELIDAWKHFPSDRVRFHRNLIIMKVNP